MIVTFKLVKWVGASAITIFPFILVSPEIKADYDKGGVLGVKTIKHEGVHIDQQKRWLIWGLGIGLLAWWLVYLLFLPVGWNPFRYRWEVAAMKAEGRTDEEIAKALKAAPYYLWWMT